MLKRKNKRLASLILIAGLSLGVVGCNNNKDNKETSKVDTKVESIVSKNDAEKEDKIKEQEKKDENKNTEESKEVNNIENTNKPNNSTSNPTSKPSANKPSNSTSNSTSKPSANKPSNNTSNSTSKPSTNKPNNNTSNSKPAKRTWKYMSSLSKETFNALNAFRKANGVAPLTYSSSEQSRANAQAESNAKNKVNTHDIDQISYKGNADTTANGFIQAWANSSGHKKNMLDEEYTAGAVSVYKDSEGTYYVVASFHLDW